MTIRPTAKASSLPPELRRHWEEAVAEKFPLSQDEALVYITGLVNKPRQDGRTFSPHRYPDRIEVQISTPYPHQQVSYQQVSYNWNSYAPSATSATSAPHWTYDTVTITDYRQPAIDKVLRKWLRIEDESVD